MEDKTLIETLEKAQGVANTVSSMMKESDSIIDQFQNAASTLDTKYQAELQSKIQKQMDIIMRKQERANARKEFVDNVKNTVSNAKDAVGNATKTVADGVKNAQENVLNAVDERIQLSQSKIDLSKAQERLDTLNKELDAAIKDAVRLGFDPRESSEIQRMANEVTKATKDVFNKQSKVDEMQAAVDEQLKNKIANVKDVVVTGVKDGFSKVHDAMDKQVAAGLGALESMKNEVILTNNKAKTAGKSAFVGLTEKCASIHRNWLAQNYEHNKTIADNLQKIHDNLAIIENTRSSIAFNFKNMWSQLTHKESLVPETPKTPETGIFGKLKESINKYNQKAQDYAKAFGDSRVASITRIAENQDLRKHFGLPEKASLDDLMKNAKAASVEFNKNKEVVPPTKNDVVK